jgi:hypothetical protein
MWSGFICCEIISTTEFGVTDIGDRQTPKMAMNKT